MALLESIPGIGMITALAIVLEVQDKRMVGENTHIPIGVFMDMAGRLRTVKDSKHGDVCQYISLIVDEKAELVKTAGSAMTKSAPRLGAGLIEAYHGSSKGR